MAFTSVTELLVLSHLDKFKSFIFYFSLAEASKLVYQSVSLQKLDHNQRLMYQDADADFRINWKRVAITSTFGFGFVGPVGHFWCVFLILFA